MALCLGRTSKIRVLSGGIGAELERIGFQLSGNPLWSAAALIDDPQSVILAHKNFIEAECDIISTNSYHTNIQNLIRFRGFTENEANTLIKKSVDLANKALKECDVKREMNIVGSVGPYATTFYDASEYSGKYVENLTDEVLANYFIQQSRPLLEGGLQTLAFETIPAKLEGLAVLKAIQRIPVRFTCWISFSCKDDSKVCYGDSFAECIEKVTMEDAVFAGGINCTAPKHITSLLQSAQSVCHGKPFVVYPNSGEQFDNGRWFHKEHVDYHSLIPIWANLGARLIGGCCRVTPNDIGLIASIAHGMK